MFNKRILVLAVLASIASVSSLTQAEPAPLINQQPIVVPGAQPVVPASIRSGGTTPTDTRWYIAPYGTLLNPAGDRSNAEVGGGGGIAIGKMIDQHFNVEIKVFAETADGYNDFRNHVPAFNAYSWHHHGSWDFVGATADLQYYFFRDKFSPYAVAALGGMETSVPGNRSAAGFIGELGAGFTYEVLDNLLVRSDIRYRFNKNDTQLTTDGSDQFNDMTANVGVVIPFGAKPRSEQYIPPAAPVSTPMPVHYAPTARPVPVYHAPMATPRPVYRAPVTTPPPAYHAPVTAPPPAYHAPVTAPPPAYYTADCSTLDADMDGIDNCTDRCPTTLKGSKVDPKGCPINPSNLNSR